MSVVQASGLEREGRLRICPVVCRQFWTVLLRLVVHQSIPIEVLSVASRDVIPTEMTGCRVVSCSRFVAQPGVETLEAMEAKLLLRCRKRHAQIRASSDCCYGRSLSVRLLELEAASEGWDRLNSTVSKNVHSQTSMRLMNSRSKEKGPVMILGMPRRLFVQIL